MTKLEAEKELLLIEVYCADFINHNIPDKDEAQKAYEHINKLRGFLSSLPRDD